MITDVVLIYFCNVDKKITMKTFPTIIMSKNFIKIFTKQVPVSEKIMRHNVNIMIYKNKQLIFTHVRTNKRFFLSSFYVLFRTYHVYLLSLHQNLEHG